MSTEPGVRIDCWVFTASSVFHNVDSVQRRSSVRRRPVSAFRSSRLGFFCICHNAAATAWSNYVVAVALGMAVPLWPMSGAGDGILSKRATFVVYLRGLWHQSGPRPTGSLCSACKRPSVFDVTRLVTVGTFWQVSKVGPPEVLVAAPVHISPSCVLEHVRLKYGLAYVQHLKSD